MLTPIKVKRVVDHYKDSFWFILDKGSVKRPTIQMAGKLPTMSGVLGAMVK